MAGLAAARLRRVWAKREAMRRHVVPVLPAEREQTIRAGWNDRTSGGRSKLQAIVLGNLSLALIRQGELDAAAGRLHEAMNVIEQNWGGGGLNIVFGAGRELSPWRTVPIVQDVCDRLLTLMTA